MALPATGVLECRTTGVDTNSGGFVAGGAGTDWSQQDAAQYSVTDGVANGSTTLTSATANFGTDVVDNYIYVSGGTGSITAGWYRIVTRSNSTTIIVDRSTGLTTGTGVTLKIGGAFATPGQVGGVYVASNDVHIKSGTYTIASTTANIATGKVLVSASGANTDSGRWIGYGSTRGDGGTKPILQAASSGFTSAIIFSVSGDRIHVENIAVDGQAKASVRGFDNSGAYGRYVRCKASNCPERGFRSSGGQDCHFLFCEATGCSNTGNGAFECSSNGTTFYGCYAHDNTVNGFYFGSFGNAHYCISYNNTGSTSVHGFDFSGVNGLLANSISVGNAGSGVRLDSANGATLINVISYGNAQWGYKSTGVLDNVLMLNCAGGKNTSGNYDAANLTRLENFLVLTATDTHGPFNAVGTDFGLNNVANGGSAGGGAACRAAGIPGVFPGLASTIGYIDIGAVQHADPVTGTTLYISFDATQFDGDSLPVTAGDKAAYLDVLEGRDVLVYPNGTDEYAAITKPFQMPPQFNSGTLTADIFFFSAATSGKVNWEIYVEAVTPGDTTDLDSTVSFDSLNDFAAVTVPGTAGYPNTAAVSVTVTNRDGVAVGDYVRFLVRRDADDATNDTAAGNAYLCTLAIREA